MFQVKEQELQLPFSLSAFKTLDHENVLTTPRSAALARAIAAKHDWSFVRVKILVTSRPRGERRTWRNARAWIAPGCLPQCVKGSMCGTGQDTSSVTVAKPLGQRHHWSLRKPRRCKSLSITNVTQYASVQCRFQLSRLVAYHRWVTVSPSVNL